MVEIRPFRALRYSSKAGSMEDLITQPYDKINEEMQDAYYEKSPYNFCRLILPKEEDRYRVAAERLRKWLREGILVKDEAPAIYLYFQDFEILGKRYTRKGFVAAVRLHPFSEKVVLPHEKTHSGPKIDRYNMLKATRKNLEMGFMLYPDPKGTSIEEMNRVSLSKPVIDVVDEYGVRNRLWCVTDGKTISTIRGVLDGEQVVIADGHHRYETAVHLRDELRREHPDAPADSAFNYRMTLMVPVEDEGLVVLPGHRVLLEHSVKEEHMKELERYFYVVSLEKEGVENFLEMCRVESESENSDSGLRGVNTGFVLYDGASFRGLKLRDRKAVEEVIEGGSEDYRALDVVILRDVVFRKVMGLPDLKIGETIDYFRWVEEAVKCVDRGKGKTAFLMNPTRPEQVLAVAKRGERMPEKSTDFYPKMVSGVTVMDIGDGERLPL